MFVHFYIFYLTFSNYYTIFLHSIKSKQYPHAYQLSAAVIFVRRRNICTRGWASQQFLNFFRKNLTVPKIVAQCRKHPIPYLNTLNRTIPYLNTLSQLSAQPTRLESSANQNQAPESSVNQNRETSALGSQSESSITSPESSANQNRAFRHRELSARPKDPSRLSARVSSL